MIEIYVDDVWKIYRGGVIALRSVSFRLYGERLVILAGPNGAGKTSLIRVMDGEISPSKGYISINGMTPDEARLKGLFGVMPQEAQLHEYLSVREYLYYLALIKGLRFGEARKEVNRLIEDFMLSDYADKKIVYLSGGYKKRVLLAQAFIGSPQILFLDEPTVGLDPEMRMRMWSIVMDYLKKYDAIAILVTHYLDEVKEYADRVLVLYRGSLIFNGTTKDLINRLGYRYRVKIKLVSNKYIDALPIDRYSYRDSEIEAFVRSDDELIKIMRFIEMYREYIADFSIDRPSLEESYIEVLRFGESS
ncbi:ABC transporter related [Ignisphaera aggregans DSM 17230]|uniref:ABC transporter related n=1 Tax=Ignisphaera aggregans (strain DSM 17230 / JCM 13409 / AQ1.S1) TaxID=583356 RepID=E0SNI7_IGNAA|nr:ABC transporter related [Ignisphaera aggregans DSM 17230]